MGSMKNVAVALIAMMLVATSSAAYAIDDDSMDLVFDGRDINHGVPRKIMKWGVLNHEERVCPKILMECKKDSDCLAESSSDFNVLDYGAVGNGKTDDSQAFLKAWKDVCRASTGIPTLRVPIGKTYLLKPLKFEGPCNPKRVHFEVRGTIMAPSVAAWRSHNEENWIQFLDIAGLNINGAGQFDGQSSSWWKDCHSNCTPPTALFFQNCTGLQLRETKHINSVKNHISLNACNDVVISNVHIIAPENIPNTYGFNISRSNNVLIQNSLIETGDECISLYNGSSNINIVGVTCGPGYGISIRSLGEDGGYNVIENINVSNCTLKGTQNGLRIKTTKGGHGYVRNVIYEKITLIDTQLPIVIDQQYSTLANTRKIKEMGIKVMDVTYREIHGISTNETTVILNCSQTRCSNIVMEDVSIQMSAPGKEVKAFCQNVDGRAVSTVPIVTCLSKSN
ncbi:probable polygalacturonase At3g15720 [Cucurbita pepo subsp. pepo]|uniref:probable polygalacturonase At3g15720 n=1 Tax=Cucurbita pepo subsp. pepo TaxID=3664 RepID=UPI000C9D7F88|nr:probable polygalacturonase At3g15720 [Cucurbita pepo subsp. pepo]